MCVVQAWVEILRVADAQMGVSRALVWSLAPGAEMWKSREATVLDRGALAARRLNLWTQVSRLNPVRGCCRGPSTSFVRAVAVVSCAVDRCTESLSARKMQQQVASFRMRSVFWKYWPMDKKLAKEDEVTRPSATASGGMCSDLLGVSDFEWKVLATIYRFGSVGAQTIADEVSASLDVTVGTLHRLAHIRAVYEGPLGWICPDADLLTELLAQNVDNELARQEEQLRQTLAAENQHTSESASDDSPRAVATDMYASWEDAVDASIFFGAQTLDLVLSGRSQRFSSDSVSKWVALIQRRGLAVRLLLHADFANSQQGRLELAPIMAVAQAVKCSNHVVLDFAIVDEKVVASGSTGPDTSAGRVVRQEVLVAASNARFSDWWKNADALTEIPERQPKLDAMQMRVVQLLVSQGNDRDRAAELDVSVRTFQRYVAQICGVLGVRTRAEIATQLDSLKEGEE